MSRYTTTTRALEPIIDESHVSIYSCSEVKEICQPLRQAFNINFFNYIKFYWGGNLFSLSAREDWTRYWHENHLYQFMKGIPDFRFKQYVYFDECEENSPYETYILKTMQDRFDMNYGVTLVKHHIGYSEFFSYAVPKSEVNFRNVFAEHLKYFKKFNYYFKDKASKLIALGEKSTFRYPYSLYDNVNFSTETQVEEKRLHELDESLSIRRFYLDNDLYLTSRETDCLKQLLAGKSYKQIARQINISVSTVQEHMNNIRYKLLCKNKQEVIELVKNSELMDLFDMKEKDEAHHSMQCFMEFLNNNLSQHQEAAMAS